MTRISRMHRWNPRKKANSAEDWYWGIIERSRGRKKVVSEEALKSELEELTDNQLVFFNKLHFEIASSLVESDGMQALIESEGYSGDFIDYVPEGYIAHGRRAFEKALHSPILDIDMEDYEGHISYVVDDVMEEREIEDLSAAQDKRMEKEGARELGFR